jgi:hypothetical protein
MSNPVNGALSKESLNALNQAVFSFLSEGGGLPAGLPTSLVQTELAALTGHFDVTVPLLFKASCDHHQLDVAAACLNPALVKPMHPVVAASKGLAGMDTFLEKSTGFSARSLLRSVAGSTEPVSQAALASIAGSLVAGLGHSEPNLVVKNGLREVAQAVTSLESNAYRLVDELRRVTALEPSAPAFMTFLDQSLLSSLMANEYDEDSKGLFIEFDLAEPATAANPNQSFASRLASFIKERLEAKVDFEDGHAEHLVQLLLDTDDQMNDFKSKFMKGIQADLDVTDSVSMALGVGRMFLQGAACAKHFNQMDAKVLAQGLKTRQDFELLNALPGIDLDRLDKRDFGVEALGGCFSADLGL